MTKNHGPIIPVPEWMKKRMAAVHSASPAPLSEMLRQGPASEEHRKKWTRPDVPNPGDTKSSTAGTPVSQFAEYIHDSDVNLKKDGGKP